MIVAFYSESSYAGKDTCADAAAAWCRRNDVPCRRDAFAWDGKVVAADALGIEGTREEKIAAIDEIKLQGDVLARVDRGADHFDIDCAVSGREYLIGLLGDPEKKTGIRGIDEKFWTEQVIRRDDEFERSGGGFTIVSDLRFLEEAQSVRMADGVIVEIVRPDAPRFNEQRLPEDFVSGVIVNDGTIEELRSKLENIMSHVAGRRVDKRYMSALRGPGTSY